MQPNEKQFHQEKNARVTGSACICMNPELSGSALASRWTVACARNGHTSLAFQLTATYSEWSFDEWALLNTNKWILRNVIIFDDPPHTKSLIHNEQTSLVGLKPINKKDLIIKANADRKQPLLACKYTFPFHHCQVWRIPSQLDAGLRRCGHIYQWIGRWLGTRDHRTWSASLNLKFNT